MTVEVKITTDFRRRLPRPLGPIPGQSVYGDGEWRRDLQPGRELERAEKDVHPHHARLRNGQECDGGAGAFFMRCNIIRECAK